MDSKYIKAVLSANFRFNKQCRWIATEAGKYNSDFLAITKDAKNLIEVEIKISKSDLSNDFKKPKHKYYSDKRDKWTPNYFYFAVPEDLVDHAVSLCVDKPYGVLVVTKPNNKVEKKWRLSESEANDPERVIKRANKYYDNVENVSIIETATGTKYMLFECMEYMKWGDRVKVVKRATKIHARRPDRKIHLQIISRLSSEMANLRISEQLK